MDDVIVKLNEKLESAVKRLREGKHDDHDLFPALLWVLVEYNRVHSDELKQLRERAESTTSEIHSLTRTLQEEFEKLRYTTTDELKKTSEETSAKIGSLAQVLKEDCDKLRNQIENAVDRFGTLLNASKEDLKQTALQNSAELQKLLDAKLDRQTEAQQSGLRRTDSRLKWILIGGVFQIIITLILMFLVLGK